MYVKTPTDGSPLSYEYDVNRNDLINYSIENIGSSRVDEVSILEGGSYRMVNQKLKKKQIEKGNIRIMNDNTFTLNIVNDGFLRNKGFLSSKLKIELKKVSPLNIIYEEVLDSVSTISKSIEIVLDTIYKSNYNKELILNPILDITGKKKLVVPISVTQEDMNLVGWGYWVGLNNSNSLDWASNEDNDMIKNQHIPQSKGGGSYPSWFFSKEKFLSTFKEAGYECLIEFDCDEDFGVGDFKGMFFGKC